MNLPWRRHESDTTSRGDVDDLWRTLTDPFQLATWGRLPEPLRGRGFPPVDVSESETHVTVSVDLHGPEVEDVSIELTGNQLLVSGQRRWKETETGGKIHRVASRYASFARALTLPPNLRLERESIEATFQDGLLEIRIPRLEPAPSATIPIRSK